MRNGTMQDVDEAVGNGKSAIAGAGQAVASAAKGVAERATGIAEKVKDAGNKAVDYVRDEAGHLGHEAHEAYSHARDKARDWEHSAEAYVQNRPVKALLIAAGVGAILALLWRRHD